MSLNSITLKTGATYPQTDGTAQTHADAGGDLNQRRLYTTVEESLLQKSVDFTVTRAKENASSPSGYTQNRRKVFLRLPAILASGARNVDTLSIELSTSVEATDAEILAHLQLGIQLLNDAETLPFWQDMSLA
jgi:hypothetical protein